MTRRPERLKATKLYGSENKAEQPNPSRINGDKLTVKDPSDTIKKDSNTESVNDHGKDLPLHSNTSTKLTGTQPMSEAKQNGPPRGFVTRLDMEHRVNRRKSITSEEQARPQNNRTGTLGENKTNNNVQSKGNPIPKAPSGFVTMKDMETLIKNRKTKSTKLTPRYQEEQTGDITIVTSVNMERGPRIKAKPDPNAKHLFSKLENRKDERTQLDKDKQLETRLPDQSKSIGTNVPKLARTSKSTIKPNPEKDIKKKSENEKANTIAKEIDKDKANSLANANDQEQKKGGTSATKSSIIITPRMTSTAIPKAPRINTKANNKLNDERNSIKILIMNANGRDDKGGTPAERRRNAIQSVVLKHAPNIVLFQEFAWKGITGKTWAKFPMPEHYVYKGHYDASIMYDANCINVKDLPASDLLTILTGLQRNANNRLKRTFPMDFNPVARMSITRVTASTKTGLDFICISWHGKSNETSGGRMKELKKIEYFEYWMEFLRHIREKYKLPILAGGDYNVDMYSIENYVESPFKLCIYEASMRRTVKGIVDFCIVTDDIDFTDISWVNLDHKKGVFHPNEILDHDPIVGSLAVSLLGASDMKLGMGKKRSWPSPIVKQK